MDKLLGFSPDVEPTNPGVMTEVVNMVLVTWVVGMSTQSSLLF